MEIRISAVVAVALLVGTAGALFGQTYEWTDAAGVVHFTDNEEMVPRKYKGTVRVRESVRSTVEDQAPLQKAAPPPIPEPPKGEELYGGKPLSWWQARFLSLANERQQVVAQLDELKVKETAKKRKKLILQRASDRAAVKEVDEQIARQEERLTSIDANIAELEGNARRAGVPERWKEPPAR